MKFIIPFIFILPQIISCNPNGSSTLITGERNLKCSESSPALGTPSLYTTPDIQYATIAAPMICDADVKDKGAIIPITYNGIFPFDSKPRGGCWKDKKGELKWFKKDKAPTEEACTTVNINGFMKFVNSIMTKQKIPTIGVGIHRCPLAKLPNELQGMDSYRKGISIHHWKYSTKAVKIVAKAMKDWNVKGTFDIRIKAISGVCLESSKIE
jgi:hypothetical protein